MIFGLNGGFAKRKCVIFASMGDSRRENMRDFWLKWGICKEKSRDFRVEWGNCEEKIRGFCLNGGFAKRKRDYCFNVVFAKRKRVIFAYMGDLQIENARFSG